MFLFLYIVITGEQSIKITAQHTVCAEIFFFLMNGKLREPIIWGIIFSLGFSIVIHIRDKAHTVLGT